ncbi:MAG: GGDEF domain-containing protein [Gammaproteobacteria bacterium]|nr:GGDEF domain-containing protein [Gammaproteobacteria bacterium]MBU3998111.1 GGDEF domain-containing protein [Gammaproteobacteria bacterium]MBU4079166.1 GGDEF domain-containing protein [Gammaproteobacteria bacterium]MBU4171094.1 GGDEF domain-containing protein [Gammaproteobacteria bacterium]
MGERTRVFTDRSVAGALTSPLGTLLLAWVGAAASGWLVALAWLSLINAVEVAIVVLGMRYRRSARRNEEAQRWARYQIVCAGLVGLAWGSSVWFFWADGYYLLYLLNLTVLVGVSGVCMIIMSAFRGATLMFSIGILLPPLVQLAYVDNPYVLQIAAGLLVLFAVQIRYAREVEQELHRELTHSVRNAALVMQLSTARLELHENHAQLEAKNAQLQSALARLNEVVTHDMLTGAFSRRHIFEQLEQQVSIRQRHGATACIMMFDLDNFKSINDRYGHPVGDRALQTVVNTVKAQLRDGDLLARVGGEEFLVLLPMTTGDAAFVLADRLRGLLSETVMHEPAGKIALPASFGVAELSAGEDVATWFKRVDDALYLAKARGRNATVQAPPLLRLAG